MHNVHYQYKPEGNHSVTLIYTWCGIYMAVKEAIEKFIIILFK